MSSLAPLLTVGVGSRQRSKRVGAGNRNLLPGNQSQHARASITLKMIDAVFIRELVNRMLI